MQFKKLHFHLLMHMICHLHYRAPKINSVKFNALTKIQEKEFMCVMLKQFYQGLSCSCFPPASSVKNSKPFCNRQPLVCRKEEVLSIIGTVTSLPG